MDQLQNAQDRLQREMELTKNELYRSAGSTTTLGKDFLLKNVLLPAGALGLGYFATKKIIQSTLKSHHNGYEETHNGYENNYEEGYESYENGHDSRIVVEKTSGSNPWFAKLMLVALPIIQQAFLKDQTQKKVHETANAAHGQTELDESQTPGSVRDLASKVVPLVIPMLQRHFASKAQDDEGFIIEKRLAADGVNYEDVQIRKDSASSTFDWLFKLMPVVLPLIQQHFLTQKVEEKKVEENPSYGSSYESVASY